MKFTVLKVGKRIADQPPAREGLPPNAERIEWDPDCPGLGLRLRGAGAKGTWVYVRKVDGVKVKRTLGRADAIDRETARAMAARIEAERQPSPPWLRAAQEKRAAPTVEEFGEVYLADWAKRWKPSTLQRNAWTVRRQIAPALGEKPLDAVTPADVANWFEAMPGAPASRNRALAILSGLMLHAEVLGWRKAGSNPCAGMRRRKTSFEAVWLDAAGWRRLGAALRAVERDAPMAVRLIRFLALTGARRGEAATLEWSMISEGRAVLRDSKSGPRTIWLGSAARRLLDELPADTSPLVFPGEDGLPLGVKLTRVWNRVRKQAKAPKLRLHDLRHGFASVAVARNESLRAVSGLLGHADLKTTTGYAHLAVQPVADAAQRVGDHLAAALDGKPQTVLVPRAMADMHAPPATPLKPKRKRLPPGPRITDADLRAFSRSTRSVGDWCAARGFNENSFRSRFRAWMRARRGAKP